MELWWEVLGVPEADVPLLEMLMDATCTPPNKNRMIPIGTQYELPLESAWVPHGFKTIEEWYEWTAG